MVIQIAIRSDVRERHFAGALGPFEETELFEVDLQLLAGLFRRSRTEKVGEEFIEVGGWETAFLTAG